MSANPWTASYDESVPSTLDYPDTPAFILLEKAAKKYPDATYSFFNGAEITYAEMDDITDRLAAGLYHDLEIRKGDRVGLFIPNTPQFVMAYWALLKIGAIVVATNPLYQAKEIVYQAKDAGMEVMILMTNNYEKVKAIQSETKIKKLVVTNLKEALPPVTRVLFTLLKEKAAGFRANVRDDDVWMKDLISKYKASDRPQIDIGIDDTALFQYSGGTTGVSKGVIASHRNIVSNACQIKAWNSTGIEGEETMLMAIPLYHAYGMVVGLIYGTMIGASFVLVPDPRNTKDVLKNLMKYKATIYPGVPAIYNAINNFPGVESLDLSSIKFCISGSAPLMRETKLRFEEITGGKLVEGYGLSETPVATHCNPVLGENKTGSIGLPFPDVKCRIVDLDDGVTDLGSGEVGEIVMQGPQIMKGYHNMPTETANALRDGWLYTGDIAYMDEDGYFYIVDRKKELIKPGGFQVWPREVEEVISDNPKVLEVGVAGIPDARSGEAVKAWVVLKEGETATEADIIAWCKGTLAGYKVPKKVDFLEELPKTAVGKILRRELVRVHKEESE